MTIRKALVTVNGQTQQLQPGDTLLANTGGARIGELIVVDFTVDVTTGDGKFFFHVPAAFDGADLITVHAEVITAGVTGTTDIQLYNVDQAVNMLSTVLSVDSGETGSDTAAAPAVIDPANDAVAAHDRLRVDVVAVSATAPKGLIITLGISGGAAVGGGVTALTFLRR